jgi:GNAT superfamily N-acetyltransferase
MILIRAARFPDDLERLQQLSPPEVKPVIEFFTQPCLVAEVDGTVAGYTQFTLGLDNVLHSRAIRVDAAFKGQGVGAALIEEKVRLAKIAGAKMHLYAVDRDGEVALKKILVKQGMHLCKDGPVQLYAEHFE